MKSILSNVFVIFIVYIISHETFGNSQSSAAEDGSPKQKRKREDSLDAIDIQTLLEDLGESLDDVPGLSSDYECTKNLNECYILLNELFDDLKYNVLTQVRKKILEKIDKFNALVLSLFEHDQVHTTNVYAITDAINLNNVNLHCVCGYISLYEDDINELFRDYIFFDESILSNKSIDDLKTIINIHFKDRQCSQSQNRIKREPNYIVDKLLPEARKEIEDFSKPFCKLNIEFLSSEKLMWKKLQNDALFTDDTFEDDTPSLIFWRKVKQNQVF